MLIINSCENTPPPALSIAKVEWATYNNERVGYKLQYPAAFNLKTDLNGKDLLLKHGGFPVMAINYTNENEAHDRGLWADHEPVGNIILANKKGKKYVYNYFNGPFFMRTLSYVIEYQSHFLAVEFRTENETIDSLQQQTGKGF